MWQYIRSVLKQSCRWKHDPSRFSEDSDETFFDFSDPDRIGHGFCDQLSGICHGQNRGSGFVGGGHRGSDPGESEKVAKELDIF